MQACKQGTPPLTVMVTDTCAGCAPGELSLQALAFSKLADPDTGRLNISYEKVRCPPPASHASDVVRCAALRDFLLRSPPVASLQAPRQM